MPMDMPKQLVTPADLNRRSREFWVKQSELLSTRIQNEALYKIAMQDLSAEQAMGMPPKYLKSLEQALARADELRAIFLRAFARNGGKAAKTDALQANRYIVRAEPNITIRALKYKMRNMERGGDSIITQRDPKAGASSDLNPQIHFDELRWKSFANNCRLGKSRSHRHSSRRH
jgi:hypothetical protein